MKDLRTSFRMVDVSDSNSDGSADEGRSKLIAEVKRLATNLSTPKKPK